MKVSPTPNFEADQALFSQFSPKYQLEITKIENYHFTFV